MGAASPRRTDAKRDARPTVPQVAETRHNRVSPIRYRNLHRVPAESTGTTAPHRATSETMRFVCEECSARISTKVLSAPNPFDNSDTITGCPSCKSVNTLRSTCDELGCWEPDTIGTPILHGQSEGYRRTCWKHVPRQDQTRLATEPQHRLNSNPCPNSSMQKPSQSLAMP